MVTPMTATVTAETRATIAATTEIPTPLVPTTTPVETEMTGNNSYTTAVVTPVTTVVLATSPAPNSNSQLFNVLNSNAAVQPSEIQQLLNSDKVPDSVKATLQLALAQSNAVYQSAIDNLNH
jgi:hypothetical protein